MMTIPTAYVNCKRHVKIVWNGKRETFAYRRNFSEIRPCSQALNYADHKAYCDIVGKLLWLALIRPDISYATKEASRDLIAPFTESVTKVKQLQRYMSGTRDHCLQTSNHQLHWVGIAFLIQQWISWSRLTQGEVFRCIRCTHCSLHDRTDLNVTANMTVGPRRRTKRSQRLQTARL